MYGLLIGLVVFINFGYYVSTNDIIRFAPKIASTEIARPPILLSA
jgi:hypothetical protein